MKAKTSVTLSSDLLREIDIAAGPQVSRSAFIEHALRAYLNDRRRRKIHARDLERINTAAAELNAEAADVLEYQTSEE